MNLSRLQRYGDTTKLDFFPPGKTFKILFDPNMNMLQIRTLDQSIFDCMREAFSATNSNAFYVSLHGYSVDETVNLINEFGYFSPGLIFDILSYININFGGLQCVYMSEQCKDYVKDYLTPLKKYTKAIDKDNFVVKNIADRTNHLRPEGKKLIMRPYQTEGVWRALFDGYGRGLVELPTSAGKSLVIANYIYNLDRSILRGLKYLVFVPNTQLVVQFYKDLIDYGFPEKSVTTLTTKTKGTKKFNRDANIIITNRQFVFHNEELVQQLGIDVLINDEVHQDAPKSRTLSIVDNLDCPFKIGFSATLPRDKYHKLCLIGSFGRIFYVKDIVELQEEGYISKLKINLLKITDEVVENDRSFLFHETPLVKFSMKNPNGIDFNDAYNAEIEYINANYKRLYSPIIDILNQVEGNTLVLFDRIEFGTNMHELAKEKVLSKKVFYIDGQTPIEEREASRTEMETTNNNIIFGQCSILSTGINIKNLTNLVLMVSTKSFSRILQSIGRTLRLHKDKEYAQLYDISFNFKYSIKHLKSRLEIYKNIYQKKPDTVKHISVK